MTETDPQSETAPAAETEPGALPANCLRLKRLGIDTRQEHVIYMRADCPVCRAEGFAVHARVRVALNGKSIIASVHHLLDSLLGQDQASLSESAWLALDAKEGDAIAISHPRPIESLAYVRAKLYGRAITPPQFAEIIDDMVAGRYSDIELSAFIAGCAGQRLDEAEVLGLTRAMVDAGERLDWGNPMIVDKHCVGGLPGNRTTPIVVSIVAADGLTMPKTSSRAITSPAGTADTMETMAPVELGLPAMRRVVEQTGGCIVWGGSVHLSPADDILIRVERALDVDSEGQLVASVLSKKIAAGSTHLVIDMPVGASAKVRSAEDAQRLTGALEAVSTALGLQTRVVVTDGRQPVGRGIGPALEAFDVLAVLQNEMAAPADLRERALELAGAVLELGGVVEPGGGIAKAAETLASGGGWKKFQEICAAQGGQREPPRSSHRRPIVAAHAGRVGAIDNRKLAKVAKLAGAPAAAAAGAELHVRLGDEVARGETLCTIHAESPGELDYAAQYAALHDDIFVVFAG
jgi:thymidine phosphorylase